MDFVVDDDLLLLRMMYRKVSSLEMNPINSMKAVTLEFGWRRCNAAPFVLFLSFGTDGMVEAVVDCPALAAVAIYFRHVTLR